MGFLPTLHELSPIFQLNLVLEFANGQSEARKQFLGERHKVIYFRHQADWESVAGEILRVRFDGAVNGKVVPVGDFQSAKC